MRRFLVVTLLLSMLATVSVGGTASGTVTAIPVPRWKAGTIKISISQSLLHFSPNIKSDSDVLTALRRSIAAWRSVADIDIVQDVSEKQSVSPSGSFGDGVSLITISQTPENVLLFKNDLESAAKTRLFVNRRGLITEADIVLSPFQQFSTDGTFGTFDIETTIKHEIGHLLGLRHSIVVGSMMYSAIPKNGVFGEFGISNGSIMADDVSAIRDLYGDDSLDDCCGVVSGRFSGVARNIRGVEVWLRDAASGTVAGHAISAKDGSFRIGGVNSGVFDVLAREVGRSSKVSTVGLGRVIVTKGETTSVSRRLSRQPIDFSLEMLGKNGILSESGLVLHKGRTYQLYIGGRNLSSEKLQVEIGSPFISVDQASVADNEYDGGISGMRFSLSVDTATPAGNYDVCVVTPAGERDCIAGGITVMDE